MMVTFSLGLFFYGNEAIISLFNAICELYADDGFIDL